MRGNSDFPPISFTVSWKFFRTCYVFYSSLYNLIFKYTYCSDGKPLQFQWGIYVFKKCYKASPGEGLNEDPPNILPLLCYCTFQLSYRLCPAKLRVVKNRVNHWVLASECGAGHGSCSSSYILHLSVSSQYCQRKLELQYK